MSVWKSKIKKIKKKSWVCRRMKKYTWEVLIWGNFWRRKWTFFPAYLMFVALCISRFHYIRIVLLVLCEIFLTICLGALDDLSRRFKELVDGNLTWKRLVVYDKNCLFLYKKSQTRIRMFHKKERWEAKS